MLGTHGVPNRERPSLPRASILVQSGGLVTESNQMTKELASLGVACVTEEINNVMRE